MNDPKWLDWARELEAIASTGLAFATNAFDAERYKAVRAIAADMATRGSALEPGEAAELFAADAGYRTPKVAVRAAVFRDDRILLVKGIDDGLWAVPGGWADINIPPAENIEREVREESGFEARATRLLGILDSRNYPRRPGFWHFYVLYFQCEITGGQPATSIETSDVGFFGLDDLPPLSTHRVTQEQIDWLSEARDRPDTPVRFE